VHLDNGAIARLIKDGLQKLTEKNIDQRQVRIPIERYRWPLLLGCALIFLSAIAVDSQWRGPPKAAPTSRLCADRFAGAEGGVI
jgi:hypothetical protein